MHMTIFAWLFLFSILISAKGDIDGGKVAHYYRGLIHGGGLDIIVLQKWFSIDSGGLGFPTQCQD